MIRARGVTKRYGATAVLDAFDLDVRPGEAVALWGANGAGKTTALKCLLGLVRASGEIAIGGVDLRRDVRLARARMGYVPQDLDLPDLPTRSLVDFFARVRGAEAGRTAEVLALVRLTDHAEKRPSELSGGLRQRLALALALVGRPSVLLLDEPTANLDQESRHVMFDVLRHQREQGVAVLFTTHRVDEVVELADRVVTLEMGRVSREEAVDDFARMQQQHQGVLVRVADGEAAGAEAALTASSYAVERRTGEWILVRAAPIHHVVSSLLDAGIEMLEVVPRGDA